MWQIIQHSRRLGNPKIFTKVFSDVQIEDISDALVRANILAHEHAEDLKADPPIQLAENTWQFDTSSGTRITYQVQPTSWKV